MNEMDKLLRICLERRMYEVLAELNAEARNPVVLSNAIWGFEKLLRKLGDENADG